jgi:hypothetical protein
MKLKTSPIYFCSKNQAASASRRLFLCDNTFYISTEALIYATATRTDTARFLACHQKHR